MGLPESKIIHQSATVRVADRTMPDDTSCVVVTFPHARMKRGFRPAFDEEFFASKAVSAVHITLQQSHWFQTEEIDAASEAIRKVTRRFQRVVTYGQSLGGYGAVALSRAVGATTILALAPQFSLDRKKAPWEHRWPEFDKGIRDGQGYCRDDLADQIAGDADLFLIYDPRLKVDAQHARAIIFEDLE